MWVGMKHQQYYSIRRNLHPQTEVGGQKYSTIGNWTKTWTYNEKGQQQWHLNDHNITATNKKMLTNKWDHKNPSDKQMTEANYKHMITIDNLITQTVDIHVLFLLTISIWRQQKKNEYHRKVDGPGAFKLRNSFLKGPKSMKLYVPFSLSVASSAIVRPKNEISRIGLRPRTKSSSAYRGMSRIVGSQRLRKHRGITVG